MTVYVVRNGQLVEKQVGPRRSGGPYLSRMEPFESPVTGKEISTWRERDADMKAVDAYDPRDLPRDHVHRHGRAALQAKDADNASRRPDDTFKWRDLDT
jgi:hypothetical protein